MDIRRNQFDNDEVHILLDKIRQKQDLSDLAATVAANPAMIGVILEFMREDKGSSKFYCDKLIRRISETNPALLYPYFDEISRLLDSNNNFIKWGAIRTVANLIPVDTEQRFGKIYNKYFDMINSASMISASNVIENVWKIVQALPEKENDISSRLFHVTDNTYLNKGEPSPECKNIVIGKVIDSFDRYFAISENQGKMLEFAHAQTSNSRKSTAKKAAAFVRKHSKD
ncbi:MAG: hypothetical protein PHV73_05010 [Eubacteriales bacterium]|nr:hypothetical protein [Eubacteriales bacterium]